MKSIAYEVGDFISVKDSLPTNELYKRYLVLTAGYYHDIAIYSTLSKLWIIDNRDVTGWVTHWMELPEIPENSLNEFLLDQFNLGEDSIFYKDLEKKEI